MAVTVVVAVAVTVTTAVSVAACVGVVRYVRKSERRRNVEMDCRRMLGWVWYIDAGALDRGIWCIVVLNGFLCLSSSLSL